MDIKTYLTFVYPGDVEKSRLLFERADNLEIDITNFEVRLRIPGESNYHRFVLDGVAIKDKKGKIVKYTGIRRDISEWAELNEQLIERHTVNNLILNNINSGLVFMNMQGVIRWSNLDKFTQMTKKIGIFSHKTGDCCSCSMDRECCNSYRCMIKSTIDANEIQTEKYVYDNDLTIEATSIPVYNSENKKNGVLLKLNDITDRQKLYHDLEKAKEEALLSNQILNEILYRIPSAMYIKDASEGFRYMKVNAVFCNTIGKDESEIIGHTDFDVFETESAELFRSFDLRLVGGEDSVSYESTLIVNGKELQWQINKSIIKTSDYKTLIIGISTDITKLHNFNIELAESRKKAEQSDKLKSAFLANMSHEIRTPLNAIVGFSDLLVESEDKQEKIEYNKLISTNNEILLCLINDILDLSKIEAGMIEFRRERFDFSSFFNELTSSFKQRLTNPDVEFIVENPYPGCYATYDRNRMAQVLTNFATNAIKYTPSGSIIVGYKYENGGIKMYVTDTGIGIPDDKKDRMFQRFEKLDDFAQGTGLGLAICKAITEADGGKIGFRSEAGKGSTFWAWKACSDIEISQNQISDNPFRQSPEMDENEVISRDILVAEDEDSNFLLIKAMLRNSQLTRAYNGIEAVKLASLHKYDAILMDIGMPQMDGLEATRQIRTFDDKVLIIAITGSVFESDRKRAFDTGCNEFLAKPLKKKELNEVLRRKVKCG